MAGILFIVSGGAAYAGTQLLSPDVAFDRNTPPSTERVTRPVRPALDRHAYDAAMLRNANLAPSLTASTSASSTEPRLWPVRAPYPLGGALLPFNRIIAYYGNFLSTRMGVLGEYPKAEMLAKLRATMAEWEAADPSTPVIPAIDYIAITAQAAPGKDGMYRLRMPDSETQKALDIAKEIDGIVILEVQIGKSTLRDELPLLRDFFKQPQVHLALDPEFAMKTSAPGTVIGGFDAKDVNYAANYLAALVDEYDLPPKLLIVHRFTKDMITHSADIKPLPQVQIIMDMDGWGGRERKLTTYQKVIHEEPVQFTGFKLFYKNDLFAPSTGMMTPAQVLKLSPQPLFIQYQ